MERLPLIQVSRIELRDQLSQYLMLFGIGRQDLPTPISMYGRIVPCRNTFADFIQSGRYVRVRPMKDHEGILLLQHFPVWIGLGYVRPHRNLSAGFGDYHGKMGGKRSVTIV